MKWNRVALLFGLVVGAGLGTPGGSAQAAEGSAPTHLPEGAIYRKPFLSTGGATLGGYIDLEFKADDRGSTFTQHRFVPFLYAEVSDRVHVASEIELEYGGNLAGDEETDGELKIEFATIDLSVTEALNVRGGIVLSPLGRLNLLHDAPMLDLTERPLVTRYVVPTTLSEAGLGVFGTFYPSEAWVLDYEAYLVNGFNGAAVDGDMLDLRGARGSKRQDNNNGRALAGRLGVSPRLGTELGVSVHTGDYDDAGRHNLTIGALDGRFAAGPLEVAGEAAMARGALEADAGDEDTARSAGFYVEGRYHFLADALRRFPGSVFTGVVRVDYVDRDRHRDGLDQERLTFGLNFRVTEETVVKNDLLFDRSRDMDATEWGDTSTGYRFSLATYF